MNLTQLSRRCRNLGKYQACPTYLAVGRLSRLGKGASPPLWWQRQFWRDAARSWWLRRWMDNEQLCPDPDYWLAHPDEW
jgi:hypothetical protein